MRGRSLSPTRILDAPLTPTVFPTLPVIFPRSLSHTTEQGALKLCRDPVAEIVGTLGGIVPVGPVQNAPEWRRDPHFAARGMLVEVDHPHHRPTVQLACPIRFTATPSTVHLRPPILDEHGAEIRAELRRRPGAP